MSVLKFEYKESTPERKQELLSEIINKYQVSNRAEMIQALAHAQAVLGCTQEEFSGHPQVNLSSRTLRTHKGEHEELYVEAFEKYSVLPQAKDVDAEVDEDALETVYQNLMARLKSNKTSTKDIAIILEYFGITKAQFKNFADYRNSTMRGFLSDNLSQIVTDESTALVVKSVIAESPFLYQGTEKTLGNTYNAKSMDMDNPLHRLEAQALGLLFISMYNGQPTDVFVNHAKALRLLKWASGAKEVGKDSHKDFERIDGKELPPKAFTEKSFVETFGNEGKEMFAKMLEIQAKANKKTAIKLPKYEEVTEDYMVSLKAFPEAEAKPLELLLAEVNGRQDRIKEKYEQYLKEINED